jgi:antirestriction protein
VIKIYIACLSSYNNGFLFGKWFDLDEYTDKDDLLEAIQEQVLDSEDNPMRIKYGEKPEEWAMHDTEGYESKTEYPDLQELIDLNELLNEENGEIILKLKDHIGLDSIDDAKRYYEDNHQGEFKDDEEFAYHIAEEVMGWKLNEGMGRYFDAEAYARDLMFEHFEIDGHYFASV